MNTEIKPGDVVGIVESDGRVTLVKVAKSNSRKIVSYLPKGRVKPIAGKNAPGELVSIGLYQAAARRLFEAGETEFGTEAEARRTISAESEKSGGPALADIESQI